MQLDLNRPLSDTELREWATRMGVRLTGVTTRDRIPTKFAPGNSYIINLSDLSHDSGTHWCVVYKMPRR